MFSRIGNFILSANTSLHVIGLMAFLPFIVMYHRLPIPSFYGEWLAAALGTVALLPLLKRESWQPLDIPHIALIFPGFLAILFIQWMLGMLYSSQYALLVASYLVWAFFLVVLGSHLRRQLGWEKIVGTLAWYVLAGGVVNTIFVLLQYASRLGVEFAFLPNLPGYGAIGQVNHFANYMALALVSLLYLLIKKRLSAGVAIVVGLLFLAMLAFSGSRSSWLYLAALAVLAFFLRAMSIRQSSSTPQLQLKQSRNLLRLVLILIPVFALVQWLIHHLPGGVALPTERLFDEFGGNATIGGWTVRLHVWYESLLLFMQSPWLGIGMGQSRWMSFMTLDAHWVRSIPATYEHSHNLIIHLLAEMGIAAALLLLAGIFAWLRSFQWRHITLEGWWLLALVALIGIHSMLEYPLWYSYFLGLVALLLGAGDEQHKQLRLTFTGRAAVVVVMVCATALLGNVLLANNKLEKWIALGAQGQINADKKNAFFQDIDWVGRHSILAPYANLVFATDLTPSPQNLAAKLWLSEAALRFIPTRTMAYRHVLLLELNGQHDQAVQYLRRAIQMNPNNFQSELQNMPQRYWEVYLDIFSEAVAPSTRPH